MGRVMPTPLGHALVGFGVAGLATALPPTRFARGWGWTAACVGLAVLPDVDHLVHAMLLRFPLRGPTHAYPTAVAVAVASCAVAARLCRDARAWLLLPYFTLAYVLHPWMDSHQWLYGNGVQLYWPFDGAYYVSPPPPLFPTEGWRWGAPEVGARILATDLVRFAPWAAAPWALRWGLDAGYHYVRGKRARGRP